MTDTDGFIPQEDLSRFLQEILDDGPLSEDDVRAACDQLVGMYLDAAALDLWQRGDLLMGWDSKQRDLIWRLGSKQQTAP